MNVCYFSSDKFVSVLATSIISLISNNKNCKLINFFVIADGISEKNKYFLTNMITQNGHKIEYLNAPDPSTLYNYSFKDKYQLGHSYVRMGIGSILPKSIEKILVLDSDTMITSDLSELWNMDLRNNIVAGVADCINVPAYRNRFFLDCKDIYCNAGVFLIDLNKWRSEGVELRIIDKIKSCNGNIFFFEQTLINYACRGQILKLDLRYNVYSALFTFSYKNLVRWRKPSNFYSEQEVNQATTFPVIIHFTRNFYSNCRPWTQGCEHPKKNQYEYYRKMTPWPELELSEQSSKTKVIRFLLHRLPQSLISCVASILYNNIRPKLFWKNE